MKPFFIFVVAIIAFWVLSPLLFPQNKHESYVAPTEQRSKMLEKKT